MSDQPSPDEAQANRLSSLVISDAGPSEHSSASTSANPIPATLNSVDASSRSGKGVASSNTTMKKQARLADLPPLPPSAPKEAVSDEELEHEEAEETVEAFAEEETEADDEVGVENLLADYADDEHVSEDALA